MRKHLGKLSIASFILLVGALGKFGNDLLDMRGKWHEQQAKAMADSVYVANRLERLEHLLEANGLADVTLQRKVKAYHPVPRFERPNPAASSLRADSVSVRSPGPIQVLSKIVTGPVGWLWRGLKAAFPPVHKESP